MPDRLRGSKVRLSCVVLRVTQGWVADEAARIGVTASDVVRGALAHFQAQAPRVREVVVRATASEQEEEEGGEMPGPRR